MAAAGAREAHAVDSAILQHLVAAGPPAHPVRVEVNRPDDGAFVLVGKDIAQQLAQPGRRVRRQQRRPVGLPLDRPRQNGRRLITGDGASGDQQLQRTNADMSARLSTALSAPRCR